MLRYLSCLVFVMYMSCIKSQSENALNEIIDSMGAEFPNIVSNPEKHRLQILYTQINRNQKNQPTFKTFSFGVDTSRYFYPASSTKLPIAVLAVEKARMINEIDIYDKFQILPGPVYRNGVDKDNSSETGYPSLAHSIRNLFIISDNSANNYLYDFLGRTNVSDICLYSFSLTSTFSLLTTSKVKPSKLFTKLTLAVLAKIKLTTESKITMRFIYDPFFL